MKLKKYCVCIVGCLLGLGILTANMSVQAGQGANMKALVHGNNTFAWQLYAQLKQEQGNLFFSPYSISTALAMAYAGARGNTASQMAGVLHFTLEQGMLHAAFAELADHFQQLEKESHITLSIANALWIEKTLELMVKFLERNTRYYGANVFQVDFTRAVEETRQKINTWVAGKTREKIQELLQKGDIDNSTPLVLTNAIYFQGNWQHPFDEKMTQAGSFWIAPNKEITVPMMNQMGKFYSAENASLQILALPYVGENLFMIILLPQGRDGLAEVEKHVNAENIKQWIMMTEQKTLAVSLPKFTTSSRFDLKRTLSAMGMPEAFSRKADFSGIISSGGLWIAKVIHEAFVEVNEKGTEASAATAVTFGRSMPREFRVDHPFLFFIYDGSSESVLFLGRVVNPSE